MLVVSSKVCRGRHFEVNMRSPWWPHDSGNGSDLTHEFQALESLPIPSLTKPPSRSQFLQ